MDRRTAWGGRAARPCAREASTAQAAAPTCCTPSFAGNLKPSGPAHASPRARCHPTPPRSVPASCSGTRGAGSRCWGQRQRKGYESRRHYHAQWEVAEGPGETAAITVPSLFLPRGPSAALLPTAVPPRSAAPLRLLPGCWLRDEVPVPQDEVPVPHDEVPVPRGCCGAAATPGPIGAPGPSDGQAPSHRPRQCGKKKLKERKKRRRKRASLSLIHI